MRIVLAMVALGVVMNSVTTVLLYGANRARAAQICDLVVNTHVDRVKRLEAMLDYLAAPDASTPGLNKYIRRVSLPQLRAEVTKERASLPPTCVAGRRLPPIPR